MRSSRIRRPRLAQALALAVGLAATASHAAAQVEGDTAAPAAAAAADTARAWMPEPAGVFLGHHRLTPPPFRLLGPRLRQERIELHWTDLSGRWWHGLDTRLASARDTLWVAAHGLTRVRGDRVERITLAPDSVRYLPYQEEPADTAPTLESFLPGRVGQYADLGMLVTGRGEMGGAWQRFEPCDAVGFNSCDQGLTPRLRPDLQFGVLLGGTITDRVHVSVDYDQAREFDASNNINVYYQGLEDEIIQRFEMGDVSIVVPQSQYLAGGIPGGNFGFRALAQIGPLELQTVWAQQQGDISTMERTIDSRTGNAFEENSITLDDHAYASGRFFFLVDPAELPGHPHIDVLDLHEQDAPEAVRPLNGTIQLYRDEDLPLSQREASQVFEARAVPPGDADQPIDGYFRLLDPNDYVVHPSGLWLMLRQPLGRNESLAMSFITESGDTVGTVNAHAVPPGGPKPELRLLRGPLSVHQPSHSTWDFEMHQVYQVYVGDLDPADLDVRIMLGDAAQGQPFVSWNGQQIPLLRLFGVDENSPTDRVDPERIFLPSEIQTGTTTITGTYLVFPTLRPFADPPATEGLTAEQADEALGEEANHRIYEERDPDLRSIARFRIVLDYRVRTDGLISEFSLGGFALREGSERIQVDGTTLRRDTDYTIDYATGMVRLTNPQQLFAGRQSPRISASFEQNALFEIAPKSIFGTTARWRLGQAGEVNLVGLHQNQRTVMARPQLGNEPSSMTMGGMTTNLRFGAGWMDRALDAIPALRLAGESSVGISGELAMSLPNPNTRGQAWLDDFEATAEVPIAMSQPLWRLGSRPGSTIGAGAWLPMTLDQTNVFELVWQHQAYGPNGGTYGAFDAQRVDTMIAVSGRDIPEPVLYLSMRDNPELPEGERVWRSVTAPISTRGSDLTSSEYLEFYALENTDDIALIFDIGTVSEDAFFVDSAGRVRSDASDDREWGLGVLDQEAPGNTPWGVDLDDGIWNQDCVTQPGLISLIGSRNANCTINNGINDTEDLNADGVPNLEDGAYFRYAVPIGPNSPYLARDRDDTGSDFRLYRIPLRGPNAIAVNGADEETWRSVRHVRMTVTSGNCTGIPNCGRDALLLSRMRISGSTWKKREIDGLLDGMIGTDTIPGDYSRNVHVGPVSALSDGSAYMNPPGTGNQAADPSQSFGASGVEVNEKGLRIAVTELEPDARAEVFYRFPSEARSFMEYGELRLWALPRAGDWGPDGTLSLLVKIGTDDGNYYLYRTRLRPPVEHRDVTSPAYWLPEIVIDFDPWFELKGRAETNAVQNGSADTVFWNDEGTHAIVLSSRAQAPNLAAIRELSLAVHNGAGLPADSAELWVNDLRLADGRTDAGFAGFVAIDARAADFATLRFSMSDQSALFHPMNADATLEGTRRMGMSGRFELGHFAPAGWGLALPLTVQHDQQGTAPEFLRQTDIRASDLEGLRDSGSRQTQLGVAVSKTTPAANPWLGLLVDDARLSLNWTNAARDAFTTSNRTSQLNGSLNYSHQLRAREVDVTPDFFVGLLRMLAPLRIERSSFFERLSRAKLRWSPSEVGFTSSYLDRKSVTYNYSAVLAGPNDDSVEPVRSPQKDLEHAASIGFRPFESISARLAASGSRDLLSGDELEASRFGEQAVERERLRLGGVDLGWERARSLHGDVEFQPRIASWLRPTVTWSSAYSTHRTPHYLEYELRVDSMNVDTLNGTMQRDFEVDREVERRVYFDPAALVRSAWGQEPGQLGAVRGALHRAGTAMLPFDVTWTDQRGSSFERSADEPGYGYRFGLGTLSSLRYVAGDTAATATRRQGFQVRSGLRLPLGLQLDGTYAENDRHGIGRQGGENVQRDRTWPDVRLGVSALPIPSFIDAYLVRASASAGYRVERSEQTFGNALRDREGESVPVQFTATFANGLTASYTGNIGASTSTETTGLRRGRDRLHSIQLRTTFDAPESLGPKFDQPISASLGFNYSSNRICNIGGFGSTDGAARCAATVDRISRDVHFSLETMISDLNLGAQFSLNDHQSFVGLRDGSSEFRLAIFANFNLGVGVLPDGLGAGRTGY